MSVIGVVLTLLRGRLPGQLVIQLTDRCNARCPQCGMRINAKFSRSTLSRDDVKRILDHAVKIGIQAVSFTGGEPFLSFDLLVELIEHAAAVGIPYIRTGTNGFFLQQALQKDFDFEVRRVAERLAATSLRNVWISIDSADLAYHEEMRGFPGIVSAIERALPIFHEYGIYPSANLGINRNVGGRRTAELEVPSGRSDIATQQRFLEGFRQAFAGFYRRVVDIGFTIVNACYPMSVDQAEDTDVLQAVYTAESSDRVVRFNRVEKALLFEALLETVPEFRSQVRVFTPCSSLYALRREQLGDNGSFPCRGGVDFFFVACRDGNTYPCGYRGHEDLGKFWALDVKKLDDHTKCRLCEWECFRDPSELAGPILELLARPIAFWNRMRRDPTYRRLWLDDWRYYRVCRFFNGREPMPDAVRDWAKVSHAVRQSESNAQTAKEVSEAVEAMV